MVDFTGNPFGLPDLGSVGGPGSRGMGEDLAPFYVVKSNGIGLEADITKFIQSVEFESSVDLVDLLKIQVFNPGFVFNLGGPDMTTQKVFQPGNEIDVWMGYGPPSNKEYLGRAIIDKHMPRYPADGIPILELVGYDAAKLMMRESAEITTAAKPKRKKGAKKDPIGTKYDKKTHSEMVEDKAQKYGFAEDVYPGSMKTDTLFQKKNMTDFQFVKGLAAINSMEFWVDYDIVQGKWVLHWKPPDYTQRPLYVLDYGHERAAIISCEAEYGLTGQITDLQVMYWSYSKQEWVRVDQAVEVPGPDVTFRKRAGAGTAQAPRRQKGGGRARAIRQNEVINSEITNVEGLRLSAGGHSIDIVPHRRFKDAADAVAYSKRWLQARRDHFIILKGECVGIESLRARQKHTVNGLGDRLSGDYYFTSFRHKQSGGSQYRCEFAAHKVMT
jgi:phage protein D